MEQQIQQILSIEYHFNVKTMSRLDGGFYDDETYVMTSVDEHKYLVKYIRYKSTVEHLQLILQFQNILHESYEYPCPKIILSIHQQYVIQHDKRFLFVQTFIEGGIEPTKQFLDENSSYFIEIGRLLAQWRIASRNFQFNLQRDQFEEFTDQWWKQQIDQNQQIHPFLLTNLIQCQQQLTNINQLFEWGLIHNDFHTNNSLITNHRTISIIDFIDAYRSVFIADLATSLFHLLIDQHQGIERAKLFLQGYQQILSLTSQEIQLIQPFVQLKLTLSIIQDLAESVTENHPFIQSCFRLLHLLNEQSTFILSLFPHPQHV